MRLDQAQGLVNSLIDTHVEMVDGANREALDNVRQDLLLLVADIVKQCKEGVDLDKAFQDVQDVTRNP